RHSRYRLSTDYWLREHRPKGFSAFRSTMARGSHKKEIAMNNMRSTIVLALVVSAVLTGGVSPPVRADLLVSNQYRSAIEHFDETTGALLGDLVPPRSGGM